MNSSFRIAHLSDLHFSDIDWKLKHFLSKRWIGNVNFYFKRKKIFDYFLLQPLPKLFSKLKIDLVLISGDVSCTSAHGEFKKAQEFVGILRDQGLDVVVLPGNHDHYTKDAYAKKVFYNYFPHSYGEQKWNLKEHGVALKPLQGSWWLVLLDTTLSTPLLCSHGSFSQAHQKYLEQALDSLPKEAKVVVANHFPLMKKGLRSDLLGRRRFFTLLKKYPMIQWYLHGHNHHQTLLDHRKKGLPLSVDTGSTTYAKRASWTLLECREFTSSFTPYSWDVKTQCWKELQSQNFTHKKDK